jgi:hypothetical protein
MIPNERDIRARVWILDRKFGSRYLTEVAAFFRKAKRKREAKRRVELRGHFRKDLSDISGSNTIVKVTTLGAVGEDLGIRMMKVHQVAKPTTALEWRQHTLRRSGQLRKRLAGNAQQARDQQCDSRHS